MSKFLDLFLDKLQPEISAKYDELSLLHSEAINHYLSINRVYKVTFSVKKTIIDQQCKIVSDYDNHLLQLRKEYEQKIIAEYKSQIQENPLRSKFITDFSKLQKRPIVKIEDKEYYLNNISSFDIYISTYVNSKYQTIKDQYKNGLSIFLENNKNAKPIKIIDNESIISIYEKNFYLTQKGILLNSTQTTFSDFCRQLRNSCLTNWGCYTYKINYASINYDGSEIIYDYKVWQLFGGSFTSNLSIDVSSYPTVRSEYDSLQKLLSSSVYYKQTTYDKIFDYIVALTGNYHNIKLLFSQDPQYVASEINFHFNYLSQRLIGENILNQDCILWDINQLIFKNEQQIINDNNLSNNTIVIIELATTNSHLKELCSKLLQLCDFIPNIVFISLEKEYEDFELIEIIENKKTQIEQEKKNEEARLRKIQEESDRKKNITLELYRAVDKWYSFPFGLKHFYPFNYYPTTCDFEATDEEWNLRRLVWNFKNDPSKTTSGDHDLALNQVIILISEILSKTFTNNLSELTLVCIPASTVLINKSRYEEFSNRLCTSLGMTNAFSHIQIIKEKTPKHLGGSGRVELEFDAGFFNGKNILLFDDIITKGNSMNIFNQKLTSLDANIIAGLSIGKTKHERDIHPMYNFAKGVFTL